MEELEKLKKEIEDLKSVIIQLTDNQRKTFDYTKSCILNIDSWIKQIKKERNDLFYLPELLSENIDNTDYNYELIEDLEDEIKDLKVEINALKLIQIITIKQQQKVKNEV